MKKHLILSLLLCFSMTAAKAGTETRTYGLTTSSGWGCSATLTGKIGISFSGQYSEFELSNKVISGSTLDVNEYTSCVIVCSEVNNVQVKVEYANDMSDLGNEDKYPSLSAGTNEITFRTDHGNVTTLAIYDNSETEASSIVIEDAYFIKAADVEGGETTEETVIYGGGGWSNSYALISPEITYSQQNAEIAIANADGTLFTFEQGNEDTYTFTVTLAEAADIKVTAKTKYAYTYEVNDTLTDVNGGDSIVVREVEAEADLGNYYDIEAGSTSCEFTISASNVTEHNISSIGIMANSEGDYPYTVKFASIVAEVSGSDITGSYDSSFTLPSSTSEGHTLGGITFGETKDEDSGSVTAETTYDAENHLISYGAAYGGCGWWLGGEDYSDYEGIEVAFKTPTTDYIQLVVEYYISEDGASDDENAQVFRSSAGLNAISGDGQTLYIDFLSSLAGRIREIYIQNGTTAGATLQVLNARLIPKSTDNEAYTYSMNLAGYSMTNWAKNGDTYNINYYTGDEGLGTVDMTFAEEDEWAWPGFGWKNWGNDGTGAFNLAEFDKIELEYTFNGDSGDSWVELTANNFEDYSASNVQENDYGKTGKIEIAIGNNVSKDPVTGDDITFDWTHVGQLVVQASGPCSITVTSIKFIRTERASENETKSLDSDDVTLGKNGGTYQVSGGTGQKHTILFPVNSAGTYDIHLAAGTTMDTDGRNDTDAGFTIPRGVTVNLYIENEDDVVNPVTINGSKYGIYAMSGSELHIYMARSKTINYGTPTTFTDNGKGEAQLNITADYGIYFLGTKFTLYDGETYNEDHIAYDGTTTITAKYCGIYFGQEFTGNEVKGTNLTITVTGNDYENDTTTEPQYICGIYNASNSTFYLSMMNLTITAEGTNTYGTYSNTTSGYGLFFGYGKFVITATKCVLHHPDGTRYSGGYGFTDDYPDEGLYVYFEFYGPFCEHLDWEDPSTGDKYYWYCDGGYGTEEGASGSTLPSNITAYAANDAVKAFDGYNVTNASEMEYYNRTLYKGWNTVSLPANYDLSATESVDATYDGVEARKVITQVATFTGVITAEQYESQYGSTEDSGTNSAKKVSTLSDEEESEEGDDDSDKPEYTFYLTFEYQNITTNPTLYADTPYLVYVNSTITDDNEDAYKILTHFTTMNITLGSVKSDHGDGLKTVYKNETMTHEGTISGDTTDGDTFYYKLYNPAMDGLDDEAYFNRPREGYTATVTPFRAYLDASQLNDQGAQSLSIVFDDGTTTSIEELDGGVNAENSRVRVYSVDGKLIKVSGSSEATKGLKRGVYVVDGKKVVVM